MSVTNVIQHVDVAGRPLTRLLVGLVCFAIGLSIAAAFVGWGFFHVPIPPVPAQDLLAPAIPFAYQAWDNWVRENGRNMVARYAGPVTAVNPHGGPAAP